MVFVALAGTSMILQWQSQNGERPTFLFTSLFVAIALIVGVAWIWLSDSLKTGVPKRAPRNTGKKWAYTFGTILFVVLAFAYIELVRSRVASPTDAGVFFAVIGFVALVTGIWHEERLSLLLGLLGFGLTAGYVFLPTWAIPLVGFGVFVVPYLGFSVAKWVGSRATPTS